MLWEKAWVQAELLYTSIVALQRSTWAHRRFTGSAQRIHRILHRDERPREASPQLIRTSQSSWRSCGGGLYPAGAELQSYELSAARWCGAFRRTGGRFPG